ncbi:MULTISPECIES: GspE/PulE family protein [unclassified Roseateles]|uniref:GspE/PulE family protein n=1 Tax=unclassified Roseateles TaxID=2626991 RepID=UPI0006F912A9|nr:MULTISPECIES: GspE/PulE family protein [unclassified Roseateles]KQW42925.1 hypothetical protein ASC81_19945 [Pelomonas sp. Root405]KRA69603.1 hypothetical protein ASD88_20595 [Pelomonas sp. Root662]
MNEAAWRADLVAARHRWSNQTGSGRLTVWDILTRDLALVPHEAWTDRLRQMGIQVLTFADVRPIELLAPGCLQVGLESNPGALMVAMEDPWDDEFLAMLARRLGRLPGLATAAAADFDRWTAQLGATPVDAKSTVTRSTDASDVQADGVIGFVAQALQEAIAQGGSDIHFETDRRGLLVKHRVDGVLRPGGRIEPVQRAEEVISRIKVLAKLDITERRIPQDGRVRYELPSGAAMDLRVSIMPSVHGEDAVLRLLDRAQLRTAEASVSLDALQFDAASVSRVRELAQLPHGMLLITGPTGSGKTTTVYGILSELNSGEEKIVTIEDPVEYELPGVLQIPVNERKGLTFAKGLRSILRHDPDRILVGEIRDAETAEIAVQSALTGHQVFTTVHANSLFDVTGRFRHFGLDMFGFVAALNGVVVQRLVRALCSNCCGERMATDRERDWLARQGFEAANHVPQVVGCDHCKSTGYSKRFVLAEVHAVDDVLRDLITGQHAISALRSHVAASGVPSLSQQAAVAIRERRTSVEEVRRVVGLA